MERTEVLRLYDHHSDEVYRLAYSYLMNRDDAQDIFALMINAPKYRIVIYLYYYVGYRPSEMAKILKLTESGVSMRMTRARRQLKLLLGEEAFNESFL